MAAAQPAPPFSSHRHAVVIPFPGRGHINPMLHFCSLLAKHSGEGLDIKFIVTQEWLELITTDDPTYQQQHNNISFLAIPNVLSSEHIRGYDHPGFLESVLTDMPAPVEEALDRLQTSHQLDIIVADTFVPWAVSLGGKRGVPVASFWPMCCSMLSLLYHRDLIPNIPIDLLSDGQRVEEEITSVPGISSIKLKDVPSFLHTGMERTLKPVVEAMNCLPKAQFLILRTMDEIESLAITALKTAFSSLSVYAIGPAIPHYKSENIDNTTGEADYIEWLNRQPERSVLYVSLGSFMAVSQDQIDELGAGLKLSGNRVLWVARDDAERLRTGFGESGKLLVKWCDQMRVLLHPAIGGFLTHCGWNSTLESVFAGVPVLAWPMNSDQGVDCKMMVDDWGIGWRFITTANNKGIVRKDEVCAAVKRFMDLGSEERMIVDRNSKKLKEMVGKGVGDDGATNELQAFLETTELSNNTS